MSGCYQPKAAVGCNLCKQVKEQIADHPRKMHIMKKSFTQPSIWSEKRRPRSASVLDGKNGESTQTFGSHEVSSDLNTTNPRSAFQQDYDRLLFSTPVRRLADKTQVWPMDENDGIRTRLTHSHEVANLARSIGTRAFLAAKDQFRDLDREVNLGDVIQPMLLAIGLGHDLGNPPFGHQGEVAIGRWFERRKDWIFSHSKEGGEPLPIAVPVKFWPEFTEFDGNPQSVRLLTRLQTHIDNVGLDLTAATLAAGIKYPVHVSGRDKRKPTAKKGGYFESEMEVVNWIREQTGLKEGQRHPLTWIMEACDDIAYSVLDVDDLLKKGMISPDDVLVILRQKLTANVTVEKLEKKFVLVEGKSLVAEIRRDIKIQYLRAFLIEDLIGHASLVFVKNAEAIFNHSHETALMDDSPLCDALKEVAQQNAFCHPSVLRSEALGAVAIDGLMTALWNSISDRKDPSDIRSKRRGARARYVFSLISPNYLDQAVNSKILPEPTADLRYRELRLLTDMVSGMTDTFALRLWNDIRAIPDDDRT